jgi:DNA polymerase gamma 1
MEYLMKRLKIKGRFMISIHDEIRFLVKDEDVNKACLALQISNIWTRAYFAQRTGMFDLPFVKNKLIPECCILFRCRY